MAHTFAFTEETDSDHVFTCTICGVQLGFNKPGIGTPNAILTGETPAPPEDADSYVEPCTEVDPA